MKLPIDISANPDYPYVTEGDFLAFDTTPQYAPAYV